MASVTEEREANPHNRAANTEPDPSAKSAIRWMLIGLVLSVMISIGYRARYGWNLENQPKLEPVPTQTF